MIFNDEYEMDGDEELVDEADDYTVAEDAREVEVFFITITRHVPHLSP